MSVLPEAAAEAITGEYDLTGLVHRLRAYVEQTGAKVVVLDSSTALFHTRPPEQTLRKIFFQLVHALKSLGLTSIITAEAPADYGQHTVLGVEDFVCDLVVTLRNVVDGRPMKSSHLWSRTSSSTALLSLLRGVGGMALSRSIAVVTQSVISPGREMHQRDEVAPPRVARWTRSSEYVRRSHRSDGRSGPRDQPWRS